MRRGILVAADYLGTRLRSDPEVHPPSRPRLPPEIVVVPFERTGILFEGGRASQVLTGTSSRTLLPDVLDQLDGTKTCGEIANAIPYASLEDVTNVVTLLFSCGLLEDGLSPKPPEELRELDSFLGRFVDVTRNNANRGEAMTRLRTATVGITGSPNATSMIAAQILESGPRPQILTDCQADSLPEVSLLMTVATREDEDLGAALAAAQQRGVWALHVRIGATETQVGPLFIPDRTGCYECLRGLHAIPSGDANPAWLPMWLSMASLQAVHLVGRMADVRLAGGFDSYNQTRHGIVHTHRYAPRLPGCNICGIAGPPLEPDSPEMLGWLFHSSIGMPPAAVSSRRAHQRHYLAQNIIETNRQADSYPGAAVTGLPPAQFVDVTTPEASRLGGRITLDSLATLLKYAAGYQHSGTDGLRRIAPTGGGMGSPELFALAGAVDGLRPGIYHYDAPRHVLEWLCDFDQDEIGAALGVSGPVHPCTIIGVGSLQRLRSKYQNFAYRIVNLDAGVAMHYLIRIAATRGLAHHELTGIHDAALSRLIRLPRKDDQYVVTFGLELGGSGNAAPPDFTKLGVRMLETLISGSTLPKSPAGDTAADSESEPVRDHGPSLEAQILTRRSLRSFADQPIPKASILALAMAACSADQEHPFSGLPWGLLRQWWLVRVDSSQLTAGVYEFDSRNAGLVRVGSGPTDSDLRQCLNQVSLAEAPALLILTASLGAWLRSRGPRGYREALLRAGAACGAVMISAESLGLGACTTAGVLEDGFRRLSRCDGFKDCPMIAVSVGYARGL